MSAKLNTPGIERFPGEPWARDGADWKRTAVRILSVGGAGMTDAERLLIALTTGLIAALATYPWWWGVSPWAGMAVAVSAAALADLPQASRVAAPFPHLAVLICALQYGLAPWLSCYYPPEAEFQITSFPRYFAYAGPAVLAVAIGWTSGIVGLGARTSLRRSASARPGLLQELDLLLWGGIVVSLLGSSWVTGGLSFVVVLLGNLRYVGALGWLILAPPGWKWRVLVVLLLEFRVAHAGAMFHTVILWGLSLFAVFITLRRYRAAVLIPGMLGFAAAVLFLQDAKWSIREATWYGWNRVTLFGQEVEISACMRPFLTEICVIESATKLFTGGYSEESIASAVNRFNQGWIVAKVLATVPETEPYAHGETIGKALEASFLPRVLAPNKAKAGGRENMERFANYPLQPGTSMDIGFGGEMYANFGYWGGIAGCGFYALALGLLFRWVARRAQSSPLWWALLPYVGHWSLKAETDVGSVLNYTVKAGILLWAVLFFLPALRSELAGSVSCENTFPSIRPSAAKLRLDEVCDEVHDEVES